MAKIDFDGHSLSRNELLDMEANYQTHVASALEDPDIVEALKVMLRKNVPSHIVHGAYVRLWRERRDRAAEPATSSWKDR